MDSIITLSSSAADKIKQFHQAEKDPSKQFRIYVQGGGCSGFEYGFSFDHSTSDDLIQAVGEVQVIIDPFSAPYIQSAVVDYFEDFKGAGFTVKNPNAKSTCGCGLSFSV